MIGCLLVVRIYNLMKEVKVYVRALYVVFLFVKMENIFIKGKKKHVYMPLWSGENRGNVWILEQVKTLDCISGFH